MPSPEVANSSGAITPALTQQLTEIIGAASPSFQKGGTVHYDEVDWTAVQTQAQKVLSPQQFTAFQTAVSNVVVRNQLGEMTKALMPQMPK